MTGRAATRFSRDSTKAVLGAACERVGLDSDGVELLRLGENAIYRLREVPVVVRIARNADHMAAAPKEVAVAEWLSKHDVPAARTWTVDQPLDVDGHPVTFWHFIDGRRGGPGDVRALGELLRRVHALPSPDTFDLPHEAVLDRVQPRIERAPIPAADRAFLLELVDELAAAVAQLRYPLVPCMIHGDGRRRGADRLRAGGLGSARVGPWDDGHRVHDRGMVDGRAVRGVRRKLRLRRHGVGWVRDGAPGARDQDDDVAHAELDESPEIVAEYERRMLTIRDVPWRPF